MGFSNRLNNLIVSDKLDQSCVHLDNQKTNHNSTKGQNIKYVDQSTRYSRSKTNQGSIRLHGQQFVFHLISIT